MPAESELEKARILFGQGNRNEARDVLIKAVRNDSRNPDIWFGLSFCVDDPQQKKDCLEKVLSLVPDHPKAKLVLEQLLIGDEDLIDTPVLTVKEQPGKPETDQGVVLPINSTQPASSGSAPEQQLERRQINNIEEGKADTQISKKAGESTFQSAKKWRKRGVIFVILIILLTIVSGTLAELNKSVFHQTNLVLPLFCGFTIVSIVLWIYVYKSADNWDDFRQGAKAEELVGEILKNLPQEYDVMHDIQLGYGNIDHFVLSKNGCMYMIETKSHRGKVTIEGDQIRINNKRTEKDFIKQTLRNTYDIRDEIMSILGISLYVTPVLVFTNAYFSPIPKTKGVFILNKTTLLKFILSGKEQQNREVIWKKRVLIQEFLYRPRW
jgi:hypothetical protein